MAIPPSLHHGRRSAPRPDAAAPTPALRPPERSTYRVLLGLFLGDGCLIFRARGLPQLVLTLDVRYPGIIAGAVAASFKNVSIARRDSVALLDRFVGPKR